MIKFYIHVYKLIVRNQQSSREVILADGFLAKLHSQIAGSETRVRKAHGTTKKNRGNLGSYGRSSRAYRRGITEYLEGHTHLRKASPCTAPIQM